VPSIPRRRKALFASLSLTVGIQAIAQSKPMTEQGAQVNCSNVTVAKGGTVNLSCTGLTKAQAKMLQSTIPGLIERMQNANDEQFADVKKRIDAISIPGQFGNLKERTLALADAMMLDLYERGWMEGRVTLPPGKRVWEHEPGPGDKPEVIYSWFNRATGYFRFKFGQQVLDIHDEYAKLNFRDRDLDYFAKSYPGALHTSNPEPVNTWGISEVADSLRRLADQLPPKTTP
jgi:hypothetical protein